MTDREAAVRCARDGCDETFDRSDAVVMSKALAGVSEIYYCSNRCAWEDKP